jgi:hypothetical protein
VRNRNAAPLALKASRSVPPGRNQIEVVDRAGEMEERVRVEAIHERPALMLQVALDLELSAEGVLRAVGPEAAPELTVHPPVRQVRHVAEHAREGQPRPGRSPS